MKHFQLYRLYKQDDPICAYERNLSVLRIGKHWLLNFNTYDSQVVRSIGVNIDFGLSWPLGDLFTLNLYLYKKNYSFSFIQKDYEMLWDEDIDWGEPHNLDLPVGTETKNEGT